MLLLVYWALNLPALGQEVALIAWQYPSYRNITLRLLEPLGALEQPCARAPRLPRSRKPPLSIAFENVGVVAAGHPVLRDINLSHRGRRACRHRGRIGRRQIQLGWAPARLASRGLGQRLRRWRRLDDAQLDQLRPHIAWVDPAVQLWNRPLADNLRYGLPDGAAHARSTSAIDAAELRRVIERLPNGLETPLGEGGGLVSGGEGQRVRFGRALLRPGVRLAILDEPFRGLDFEQRRNVAGMCARDLARCHPACHLARHRRSHRPSSACWCWKTAASWKTAIRESWRAIPSRASTPCWKPSALVREEFWNGPEWRHLHLNHGQLTA